MTVAAPSASRRNFLLISGRGKNTISPPADTDFSATSSTLLEELTTEIDDIPSIANLLTYVPFSPLHRLSVSLIDEGKRFTESARHACSLVRQHHKMLQEIVFSNAWKLPYSFAGLFDDEWGNLFRITDLVLGTDYGPAAGPSGAPSQLWYYLTAISLGKRFGTHLARIRIESSDVLNFVDSTSDSDSRFESLLSSSATLKHLRILIISPKRPNQTQHKDMDFGTYEEGRLAEKIARYGPPSLPLHQHWPRSFLDRPLGG